MDIVFEGFCEDSDIPRKEISFTLSFEGAVPSRESIKDEISVCYGVPAGLVALDRLRVVRKKKKANGRARIYEDLDTFEEYEKKRRPKGH